MLIRPWPPSSIRASLASSFAGTLTRARASISERPLRLIRSTSRHGRMGSSSGRRSRRWRRDLDFPPRHSPGAASRTTARARACPFPMDFLVTLPLATLSSAARLSTIGFCAVRRNRSLSQPVKRVCVCGNETRAMMKHPSPSDFVIDVTDTHVIVTFNPSGRPYTFGRLSAPLTTGARANAPKSAAWLTSVMCPSTGAWNAPTPMLATPDASSTTKSATGSTSHASTGSTWCYGRRRKGLPRLS